MVVRFSDADATEHPWTMKTSGGGSGRSEDRGGTRLDNRYGADCHAELRPLLERRTEPFTRQPQRRLVTSRSAVVVPVCRDAWGSRAATILHAAEPALRNPVLHTHTPTHSTPQERPSKYSGRCEVDTVPSHAATHPGDHDPRAATDRNRLVTESATPSGCALVPSTAEGLLLRLQDGAHCDPAAVAGSAYGCSERCGASRMNALRCRLLRGASARKEKAMRAGFPSSRTSNASHGSVRERRRA